jgi:HSP20 family protein
MARKLSNLWEKILLFQDRMDKIIESIDSEYTTSYLMLSCDIIETDKYILIKIDAPGIEKNSINIFFKKNLLIIEAVKQKDYFSECKYIIAERRFGQFKNIIEIPENFDIRSIDYYIKDGVITIKIKKTEEV